MVLTGVVALDGPSGTGKSTVARALARRLGARYLDTGAMYRAVAWAVLEAGADPHDAPTVTSIARQVSLEITTDPRDQRVQVDGQPVDREIRSVPVTVAVSPVSAVPEVREVLVAAQRDLIAHAAKDDYGIVVEGRDIGTVVAPDAELKVFLTASADERAARRSLQDGTDDPGVVAATRAALHRRDTYDSTRAASPLQAAEDAVELDTTRLPFDAVVDLLADLARSRGLIDEDGT